MTPAHRTALALLPWWLASCATPFSAAFNAPTTTPPRPESTSPLHQALLGLWCNSEDGGRSCWAWDEFLPDGRLQMCGRTADDPQPFAAVAQVHWEGRRMCYRVLQATANFWLPPGQSYCTDIVEVAARHHSYRDLDSGARFTLWRRPAADRDCPALLPVAGSEPVSAPTASR